jgi:hypothetical protein
MAGDENTLTQQDEVLEAAASTSTAGQLETKKDDTKSTEDTTKDSKDQESTKEDAVDEKASESGPKPEGESKPAPPPLLVPQTHQTYINFLFLSGRRKLMHFEPDTTIGRVKELVWAAWSTPTSPGAANTDVQIEEQPPAPAYLRVLYLGRMLQDDETLRGSCFLCSMTRVSFLLISRDRPQTAYSSPIVESYPWREPSSCTSIYNYASLHPAIPTSSRRHGQEG